MKPCLQKFNLKLLSSIHNFLRITLNVICFYSECFFFSFSAHSPPSFFAPNLTDSGVFANKSKDSEIFPLQNEALESCLKMKSVLTREVYVVYVSL